MKTEKQFETTKLPFNWAIQDWSYLATLTPEQFKKYREKYVPNTNR